MKTDGCLFALFQAVLRVRDLRFRVAENMLLLAEIIAAAEMVTGVLLLLWMAGRNKKYGLGGQTILIYINIVDRMMSTLLRFDIKALLVPLGISAAAMVVTLIMEGGEKRIAVQRISIYNVYADKNYLAIKLNPAGVMPVMFSSAFFTLLKLIAVGLHWLFPKNLRIAWWQDNLVLTTIPGIWVYILLIYFLTIGFSMIMIGPGNIAEQFLKGGDRYPEYPCRSGYQKVPDEAHYDYWLFQRYRNEHLSGMPPVFAAEGRN